MFKSITLILSFLCYAVSPSTVYAANKEQVLELFSFSCNHCSYFEPLLEQWVPTKNITFKKVPVAYRLIDKPLQQLYLTMKILNAPDNLYKDVFNLIHAQKVNLTTDENIINWAVSRGFNKESFLQVYNSADVKNKMIEADELTKKYGMKGIPLFVIKNNVIHHYKNDVSKTETYNGETIQYKGVRELNSILTTADTMLK